MSIIKKLKKVADEVIQNEPWVNYGGCCVYAAKVGRALKDLGYEVRVIHPGVKAERDKPEIKCQDKAELELGVDFYHIGLAVKSGGRWYTHDAEITRKGLCVFSPDALPVSRTYLTVEQAEAFAKRRDFWNPKYKRRTGNKIISQAVAKHLKSV